MLAYSMRITFGCFTLTDEESASGVAVGEQLPLCILSA